MKKRSIAVPLNVRDFEYEIKFSSKDFLSTFYPDVLYVIVDKNNNGLNVIGKPDYEIPHDSVLIVFRQVSDEDKLLLTSYLYGKNAFDVFGIRLKGEIDF